MFVYRVYNLSIASQKELPELIPSNDIEADVTVQFGSAKTLDKPSRLFMKWYLPSGELWCSFAKVAGGYLLKFDKFADFFVTDDGNEIICMTKDGIPPETIQHLLLDQVIPLVINLKGGEALHASSVLAPQGVIAFAGHAGSGKSTLAGSFLLSGYGYVSDDCLTLLENVNELHALPAYPGLRLWDDALTHLFGDNGSHESVAHYTDKRRVELKKRLEAHCTQPQPLRRLYTIVNPSETERESGIKIERLSSRESFMALVESAFRLDITDHKMLARQFHFLERVAAKISVRRLAFPRDFNLLPAVRGAILQDLKDMVD